MQGSDLRGLRHIKVPLTDIYYAGGRSTNSTFLESKYVDGTMRPTKATLLLFGYMKNNTPVEEPRSGSVPRRHRIPTSKNKAATALLTTK